jgi:hypothetical protein
MDIKRTRVPQSSEHSKCPSRLLISRPFTEQAYVTICPLLGPQEVRKGVTHKDCPKTCYNKDCPTANTPSEVLFLRLKFTELPPAFLEDCFCGILCLFLVAVHTTVKTPFGACVYNSGFIKLYSRDLSCLRSYYNLRPFFSCSRFLRPLASLKSPPFPQLLFLVHFLSCFTLSFPFLLTPNFSLQTSHDSNSFVVPHLLLQHLFPHLFSPL